MLSRLEELINYSFSDKGLLRQALLHRSYSHEQAQETQDNECLEFLGDAVLGLAVSHLIFCRYSSCDEGMLAQLKAALVSEPQLAELGRKLNLGDYILLGKGEELSGGRSKDSLLANTYEALLGAVYMDGGLAPVEALVRTHFLPILPVEVSKGALLDFKSRLQEYTQETIKEVPEYILVKEAGPEHKKEFTVAMTLHGETIAYGTGKSKKAAEQKAAELAFKKLRACSTQGNHYKS